MTSARILQLESKFLQLNQRLDAQTIACRRISEAIEANESGKNMADYLNEKHVSAYVRYWRIMDEIAAVKAACGE